VLPTAQRLPDKSALRILTGPSECQLSLAFVGERCIHIAKVCGSSPHAPTGKFVF